MLKHIKPSVRKRCASVLLSASERSGREVSRPSHSLQQIFKLTENKMKEICAHLATCVSACRVKSWAQQVQYALKTQKSQNQLENHAPHLLYSCFFAEVETSGFSFAECGVLRASTGKVVSCHFSADGKILATAGHDKKVRITLKTQ